MTTILNRIIDIQSPEGQQGSILSLIEQEMTQQNLNLPMLAQLTGINRGLLSALFTRIPPKSMSIRQLDLIGRALGQSEGWLYEQFAQECFASGKIHWKQIKNFLIRCVELEKNDLIEFVLSRTTEEPIHIQDIFQLGESLYFSGNQKASIPFYRCVCENEIKQHSERLAISHYRWFRARLGEDVKENHEAAVHFAPYRRRLSINIRLDALIQLANVFFRLQHWKDVIQYADELGELMLIILRQKADRKRRGKAEKELFRTDRHLVFYYGQSYLLKGNALEWMGQYEEAMQYISGYEDLSWFEDLDENGLLEVRKFSRFAEANRYNLNILMGNFQYLSGYQDFLDKHPEEWLPSMLTIMTAVNRYNYDASDVLNHFSSNLSGLFQASKPDRHSYYQDVFQRDRCAQLCYQLALYFLSRCTYETGINWLLQALQHALISNNKDLTIISLAYFEQYRTYASSRQIQKHQLFLRGAIQNAQISVITSTVELSM